MVGEVWKFLASRQQENTFPRLKSYINYYFPGIYFLEGHFQDVKNLERRGLGEQCLPENFQILMV